MKVDLNKLLEGCPIGYPFYSSLLGDVSFYGKNEQDDGNVTFTFESPNGYCVTVKSDGLYPESTEGECIIFPRRDQRDWSKFRLFKEGDILRRSNGDLFILKSISKNGVVDCYLLLTKELDARGNRLKLDCELTLDIRTCSIATSEDEIKIQTALDQSPPAMRNQFKLNLSKWSEFKVGDVIVVDNDKFFIFKSYCNNNLEHYAASIPDESTGKHIIVAGKDKSYNVCGLNVRLATAEEYIRFHQFIESVGLEWDSSQLMIKRVSRYNVDAFKPFDRVLCRQTDSADWIIDYFDSYGKSTDYYPFKCIRGGWRQCIPYNKHTRHLHNTSIKPLQKYISWDDSNMHLKVAESKFDDLLNLKNLKDHKTYYNGLLAYVSSTNSIYMLVDDTHLESPSSWQLIGKSVEVIFEN